MDSGLAVWAAGLALMVGACSIVSDLADQEACEAAERWRDAQLPTDFDADSDPDSVGPVSCRHPWTADDYRYVADQYQSRINAASGYAADAYREIQARFRARAETLENR